MQLDHVCVAVKSIEIARERLCGSLSYRPRTELVTNTRQKVHVVFLKQAGSPDIKLIQPAGEDSPLWSFLKTKGEGLHHLCFRVEDLRSDLPALAARGLRLLGSAEPGEAFEEAPIAFCYAGFGLNIEFIDTDRRRAELPADDQSR